MTEITRRRLLGSAAATAGGAAALSMLPPSVHRALAMPMRPGGLRAVEHIILLMQENRSFDHYLGALRGVRGFGDSAPLQLPHGPTVFAQPVPGGGGRVLPFSLRKAALREGRDPDDIQYVGDLDHSFEGTTQAWADGWNNGWIGAKGPSCMTHYERRDIPLQYELADTFTVCDAYHCSVFGSTNPNRNYFFTGKVGYEPGSKERAVTNAAYSYDHAGYDWKTYPERLQRAGVSWQIYQEWDNFTDNPVEYFVRFKKIGHRILAAVDGAYRTTEEFYYAVLDAPPSKRTRMLAQFEQGRSTLSASDRSLFDRAMYRSEPETLVSRVRADIAAGTLPAVSWLVPSAVDSEHPGASTPVASANLMYDLLDAIASDPDTWSSTILLINFDENDGYFDHVPPPVSRRPASGNSPDWYDGLPIGMGPRVPMTIVSPWTVGGHVSSEVFDHTSPLRLLEQWTGVRERNISQWRRKAAGDLTSVFDFEAAGRAPRVDHPGPVPNPIDRWHPAPPESQAQPEQETGRRPARALPYRVRASAEVDSSRVRLWLVNRGAAAAHFTVYPYNGEAPRPLHFDVEDEHLEMLPVRGGSYRLSVQGPNRFWYELAGSTAAGATNVDVLTKTVRGRSGLELVLRNGASAAATIGLRDRGPRLRHTTVVVRGGGTKVVTWPTDHGWYDVEVTSGHDDDYYRRLTGHVETGRGGLTP